MSDQNESNSDRGRQETHNRIVKLLQGAALILVIIGLFPLVIGFLCLLAANKLEQAYYASQIAMPTGLFWTLAVGCYAAAAFTAQKEQLAMQKAQTTNADEQYRAEGRQRYVQRVERTFFELVKLHHELVAGINLLSNDGKYIPGRRGLAELFRQFYGEYHGHVVPPIDGIELQTLVTHHYSTFFNEKAVYLNHYFRNLFEIIRYVDRSNVGNTVPLLMKFLRAQLSTTELQLLFYQALSDRGPDPIKALIEKHSLLESLNSGMLLHTSHITFYKASAYESPQT